MLLVPAECSSLSLAVAVGGGPAGTGFLSTPLVPHAVLQPLAATGNRCLWRRSCTLELLLPLEQPQTPPPALPCSPGAGCCFTASSWPTVTPP